MNNFLQVFVIYFKINMIIEKMKIGRVKFQCSATSRGSGSGSLIVYSENLGIFCKTHDFNFLLNSPIFVEFRILEGRAFQSEDPLKQKLF